MGATFGLRLSIPELDTGSSATDSTCSTRVIRTSLADSLDRASHMTIGRSGFEVEGYADVIGGIPARALEELRAMMNGISRRSK